MKLADLRGRKRTLVVVSVVMIAFGWFLHPDSDATVGQFRSVAGRKEYVTHYREAMRRFPTPPSVTADIGAHIVGHSFGGATAAAYARHYPTEVRSLTLLEPVFTFSYPSARLMAWTMVASLPGLPTGWRNHALGRIGGTDYDPTEPMARMIDAGTHHYDAHLPTPSLLSDDDVHALTMPCYVAIASTDSLAGGDKASRSHSIGRIMAF